jgi:actin beta/gamma 1
MSGGTFHQDGYIGGDDDIQAIILDNGSWSCKAGFSGDDGPRKIISSVIGRPRHASVDMGEEARDGLIGTDALAKRGVLRLAYPIEHGLVHNWDDMEKIWFVSWLRVVSSNL